MSNAKPYLFGTVLGASAMYVALQYHVVHSHVGFQMVPRTPQHSVGLAYADVRSWTPSQWTDRPELARALMAHGSSDLISQSVATSLADSVAEENSTLDQLDSPVDSFNSAGHTANNGVNSDGTAAAKPSSTSHFTQAMEDHMFGNPAPARKSAGTPKPAATDASQSMFEDVSSQLESRAQAALNRAQSAATEKAGSVLKDGAASSQDYVRQPLEQAAPDALKSLIPGSTSSPAEKAAQTGGSLLDQFDPFLE